VRPSDLVFDLDGVVWVGDHPIGNAGEVLTAAVDAGINVLFVTNNASRTRGDLATRLQEITGFAAEERSVVNAAMAGASLLGPDDRTCFVAAGPGVNEAIADVGVAATDDWEQADAVIAGFSRTMDYPLLRDATLAIRRGARFIATNTDSTFPAPNGQWPGAGATIAFLVEATGVRPVVGGKPHKPMMELVARRLAGEQVVMVGDRPETDLALAKLGGWTSVLALSGVTARVEDVDQRFRPDMVVETIADLPALLGF
jgi:HAD superfamily hydrolase (TIGR01450 family)